MQIKKRSLPVYMLLNCLTLGIYGFVVSMQIGKEINALCKGDGEEPRFGYAAAVMFRGIAPLLGLLVGLILSLANISGLPLFIPGFGERKAASVFSSMLACGVLFTLIGSIASGIYLKYWWYKQANRLKLNANRYGLVVKEGGTENFLFHTALELLFIPISIILFELSFAIPNLILWLISLADSEAAVVVVSILALLFWLPLMFFGTELTTGSGFAMFFIFKNLNRFADVYRNGAAPFDPMAYTYYPSHENKYPNVLPGLLNGGAVAGGAAAADEGIPATEVDEGVSTGVLGTTGSLQGLNGTCAGYTFDMTSGEEIIIGKDAKMASVVIDPAYKEISRKHVGVCYDLIRDQYRVVDYSSNGTWANGSKLTPGQETYLPHGTELKLANGKNTFRLG